MFVKCGIRRSDHNDMTESKYYDIELIIDGKVIDADTWVRSINNVLDVGYANVSVQHLLKAKCVKYSVRCFENKGPNFPPIITDYDFCGSGRSFIKWWFKIDKKQFPTDDISQL